MKKISLFFLIFFILLSNYKDKYAVINSTCTNKFKDIWTISIPSINLSEVVVLDTIYSKDISGIVLFKEYGRPDEKDNNTIIGAHSGVGADAYFNDIDKLNNEDKIIIYYKHTHYTYVLVNKYKVDETDLSPLNSKGDMTTLTLITCDKSNVKRRLIVVAKQVESM